MNKKYKVTLTSIIAVISLLAVIIITNDAFDGLQYKNLILSSIVILQLCLAIYGICRKPNK